MSERFNESEYVAAFFESLSSSIVLTGYRIPSLQDEGKLGYDLKIMTEPGIPILFQFKSAKNTENCTDANVSGFDYCIFFRSQNNFRQHSMLIKSLIRISPCLAYYSSPKFDTWKDLESARKGNNVLFNSAFFCVNEIGPINNDMKKICYETGNNNAAICPIRRPIQLYEFSDVAKFAGIKLSLHRQPLWQTVDKILNSLKSVFPSNIPLKVTRTSKKPQRGPSSPPSTKFLELVTMTEETTTHFVSNFSRNDGINYSDKLVHLFSVLYRELGVILVVYQPE